MLHLSGGSLIDESLKICRNCKNSYLSVQHIVQHFKTNGLPIVCIVDGSVYGNDDPCHCPSEFRPDNQEFKNDL
jgi:hypothetical protein